MKKWFNEYGGIVIVVVGLFICAITALSALRKIDQRTAREQVLQQQLHDLNERLAWTINHCGEDVGPYIRETQ